MGSVQIIDIWLQQAQLSHNSTLFENIFGSKTELSGSYVSVFLIAEHTLPTIKY